jgi:hypothetical protein
VTVVDGQFRRHAGFGVVMAASGEEASTLMAEYLRNDHAYGKAYEVSRVEPHESSEPYVAFFDWADVGGGWPATRAFAAASRRRLPRCLVAVARP